MAWNERTVSGATRRDHFSQLVAELQERYCARLEEVDGSAVFSSDRWQRPGGGGGHTCALSDGAVFERAGVNVSAVHGELSEAMAARLGGDGRAFFAAGLSVILHPRSPMIPTVHMNIRYIEKGDEAWLGGGADLTPYYLYEEDAVHFHGVLHAVCERYEAGSYDRFKVDCDRYFHVTHRGEARGIGGIFFDQLRGDLDRGIALNTDLGRSFLDAYVPIVDRRRAEPWGEHERAWQCQRRGRYVEFNLVHDRGTLFGLETGGRIESILLSLPPEVHWRYAYEPEDGSREAELLTLLRSPARDWISA